MRRRALLASLAAGAAGLAGCSFGNSSDDPATDPGTEPPGADGPGATGPFGTDPTATAPGTRTDQPSDGTDVPPDGTDRPGDGTGTEPPDGYASVVDLETAPRTYAFAPTRIHTDDGTDVALWFDRTATDRHPARLVGRIENANDYANTVELQWIPAVGRVHGRQPDGYDHEAALHLAPTAANELAETVPDLARTDQGHWYAADIGPWMPERVRLEAGERRHLAYAVVGERGSPGRPTGTYEFRGDDEQARITVWETTSPGPEVGSRFAGRSLPALADERTVEWYHEADRTTAAFVRPSAERLELDGRVAFEAVNHSDDDLGCGHWDLHKLVDGEWFHVGPRGHFSDCRSLAPGETKTWSLRAFNGEAVGCGCEGVRDGLTRGYLGGGTYAVVAGYGVDGGHSGALVELVGDPAPVVPEDGVTSERSDGTVTVTTARYVDGGHPSSGSFTLERADGADERLIAEQVMGEGWLASGGGALRNALPFLTDGVERVVVRTDEHGVDAAVGYDGSTRRFRFRGRAYEVTTERSEN